ncbi:tubulin epsilon chain-like isoform X2 [Ornithodoros turicata]|uniref:tubulin epsilon chain-like isoform X2 n=1 Tax=Ornithodoros turicata TaxID=34597 RepID=UPI00313899CF
MTQFIVVQVGQCGNQIGCRFWDYALREHTLLKDTVAVMIDMEEGVINSTLRTPLGNLFTNHQMVTDVSGSGNNWAVGFYEYGSKYRSTIVEKIRKEAELCDCLQGFFLLHSLGGGTGSGLGSAVLQMLKDEFPSVFRFVTSVIPSATDDVVTSPYNTALAFEKIAEFADCSCPVENQALINICDQLQKVQRSTTKDTSAYSKLGQRKQAFDQINSIVAYLLLNLTSSSRFPGSLNVDLNELCTSLVPYPKLHFLVSSVTPLHHIFDASLPSRRLDQMFSDAFSANHQLVQCNVKSGALLACTLLARGNVSISDIRRNVERIRSELRFVHWNQDGWKTGLCSVPPIGAQPHSLLMLANATCIRHTMDRLRTDAAKLYTRKAHLHHFLKVAGMEETHFGDALAQLGEVSAEYKTLETTDYSRLVLPRLGVLL